MLLILQLRPINMNKSCKYIINSQLNPTIENLLKQNFNIEKQESQTVILAYFDTFDWRLYNASLFLYQANNSVFLHNLSNNKVEEFNSQQPIPAFAQNIQNKELQHKLLKYTEIRAILKMAEVSVTIEQYNVLNKDKKTVVKIVKETYNLPDKSMVLLKTIPIRGYKNAYQKVGDLVTEIKIPLTDNFAVYYKIMQAFDKNPGKYSSKLNVKLESDMPLVQAVKLILQNLLEITKTNEKYLCEDIDTEFLHDFRVSVRRARSLLSQAKNVFSDITTRKGKSILAEIQKSTNELRDLDVYLLKQEEYENKLPGNVKKDIAPLFNYLRLKRKKVLSDVVEYIKSDIYKNNIAEWEKIVNNRYRGSKTAVNAERPVIDMAKESIYSRYEKILKKGKLLQKEPVEAKLHDLRIDCKKLRYLLEFFSGLFPISEMTQLIKQLKKLQENLGTINDLFIQQEYLRKSSIELLKQKSNKTNTILAIGCLIGILDNDKQKEINEFASYFRLFSSKKNRQTFSNLFYHETKPKSNDNNTT